MQERHEQRRSDDGPDDWERVAANRDGEGFAQTQLTRDPWPDEGADEPKCGGHDEPAAHSARERLSLIHI